MILSPLENLAFALIGGIVVGLLCGLLQTRAPSNRDSMAPGYGSEYRSEAEVRARFMNGKCKRWAYMAEIARTSEQEHISLLEAAETVVVLRHHEELPPRVAEALQTERAHLNIGERAYPAGEKTIMQRIDEGQTMQVTTSDEYPIPVAGTVFEPVSRKSAGK